MKKLIEVSLKSSICFECDYDNWIYYGKEKEEYCIRSHKPTSMKLF